MLYSKTGHEYIQRFSGSGIPCLTVIDKYGNILVHTYEKGEYQSPQWAIDQILPIIKAANKVLELEPVSDE